MTTQSKTAAFPVDPAVFRELAAQVDLLTDAITEEAVRCVAKQIAEQTGITEAFATPALVAVLDFAKAHRSIDTPELQAELMRKVEEAVARRLGAQPPVAKPSLFHGSAMFSGITITNHGTAERPLFRLEDVARLVQMPAEEILESLDARDAIETRRCELTGSDESFVTEPGLFQALMWGESPTAEAFKCRVASIINNNPALQRKANELLAEMADEWKKPRA